MTDLILLEAAYENVKLALAPTLCKEMSMEQLIAAIRNRDNHPDIVDIFLDELLLRKKNQ